MVRTFLTFITAIVVLWLGISVLYLPRYATTVGDNPVTKTPLERGVHYDDVTITSDELALPGWWMPAENPRAALMFVHGAGSNRTSHFIDSLNLYAALVNEGISVLTVDLRNHGNAPKTDGYLTMGISESRDVFAMSRWLDAQVPRTLPRLVMGASMGGATIIQALAQGLQVSGIILLDPALNTVDSLMHGAKVTTHLPASLFLPFAWATSTFYGLPTGDTDTARLAEQIQQPLLLIQDPDDPVTRLPFAQALAAANDHVQLAIAQSVPAHASCIQNKGRWGSHVAAFKCDNAWTLSEINRYITGLAL